MSEFREADPPKRNWIDRCHDLLAIEYPRIGVAVVWTVLIGMVFLGVLSSVLP